MKGFGLICAEYQGSGAKIAPQSDEYNNDEYDINDENERMTLKTDKVSFPTSIHQNK